MMEPQQGMWTTEQDDELKVLWPRRDLTQKAICYKLGKGDSSVRRRSRELGLQPRTNADRAFTDEVDENIKTLWATDNIRRIAAKLGMTPELIHKRTKILGLPPRPKGWQRLKDAQGWTPARVELLIQMWEVDLLPAPQIAQALSKGLLKPLTPNAVIGKANRMGLTPRTPNMHFTVVGSTPKAQRQTPPKPPKPPKLFVVKPEPATFAPKAAITLPPQVKGVSFMDLSDTGCKWSVGDGFCGEDAGRGPYCDHHKSLSKQPRRAVSPERRRHVC